MSPKQFSHKNQQRFFVQNIADSQLNLKSDKWLNIMKLYGVYCLSLLP